MVLDGFKTIFADKIVLKPSKIFLKSGRPAPMQVTQYNVKMKELETLAVA